MDRFCKIAFGRNKTQDIRNLHCATLALLTCLKNIGLVQNKTIDCTNLFECDHFYRIIHKFGRYTVLPRYTYIIWGNNHTIIPVILAFSSPSSTSGFYYYVPQSPYLFNAGLANELRLISVLIESITNVYDMGPWFPLDKTNHQW